MKNIIKKTEENILEIQDNIIINKGGLKMFENLTDKETETMIQFITDRNEGLKESNITEEFSKDIEALVKQSQLKSLLKGAKVCIIQADLTSNGGNISIMNGTLRKDFKEYGDYLDIGNSVEQVFLFEKADYSGKLIEPYNRQNPFYIGYSFDTLKKLIKDKNYTVYINKEKNICGGYGTRLDDYSYNNYWQSISFSSFITTGTEKEFVGKLIRKFYGVYNSNLIKDEVY